MQTSAAVDRYRYTSHSTTVGFVFGALAASVLSGPVLVRMLGELGISESTARNVITSMRQRGSLLGDRAGRVVAYRLAPGVLARYQEIEGTAAGSRWAGAFHGLLYDVGEKHRLFRDRFRYLVRHAGYGLLRPGVLISPDDRLERVVDRIGDAPEGSWFFPVLITPSDLDDARRMTAIAWDLAVMAGQYREVIDELDRTRDRIGSRSVGAEPWPLLREWHRMYDRVLALQMDDPGLPVELLPNDWPGGSYWRALFAVNGVIGSFIQSQLRAEVSELDQEGVCLFYRPPWEDPAATVATRV